MSNPNRHLVDAEGLRLIRDGIEETIKLIKHIGIAPSTLSLDAAWLIYIFRTQTALYRHGHDDVPVTRMVASFTTDPVHNIRPEFEQVWKDLISGL